MIRFASLMTRRMARLLGGVLGCLLLAAHAMPSAAADPLAQAREYRDQGELRAASIELKNVLQASPNDADARLLLGKVYVGMGTGSAADKELRQAVELGKSEQEVVYWRARAIRQQGKEERLLAEIEAMDGWPDEIRGRVAAVRAQAQLALAETSAANEALQRAQRLAPGDLETRIAAIRIALTDERPEQAGDLAAEATEAFPRSDRAWRLRARAAMARNELDAADDYLTRAIEHAFAPHGERLMRARVRMSRGRYEQAREDVDWVSGRAPQDPRVQLVQGLLARGTGEEEKACGHFGQVVAEAPGMREARYHAGICHYRNGAYNQAEVHLRAAYQGRAVPRVALMLGATYLAQQRYERARDILRPLLQSNPDDTEALALMAEVEHGAGHSDKAIEYLRRLAERRPDDPQVRLELGMGLVRSGDVETGQDVLGEALRLDPGFGRAGALLVLSQMREEAYGEALATARELSAEQPEAPLPPTLEGLVHLARDARDAARSAFEKAVALDGGDPAARHALARMALDRGDTSSARDHYRAVLEASPEHTETLTALAVLEARNGHPGRVGPLLERAHAADPGAHRPRFMLARFHLSRDRPRDALRVLRDEEGAIPEHGEALLLAARARLAAGQHVQAIEAIERLRQLRPSSVEPYLLLTRAYRAMGEAERATAQMDRILELAPDHPFALVVKARVNLGEGNTEQARGYLERVPEDAHTHPTWLSAMGHLSLQSGAPVEARDYYRRAYQQAPSPRTVTRAAALERAIGNTDEARALLESWVADHPEDARVQRSLGDLHASQGREAEAVKAYKAILDQNPGAVGALNNLAWILRDDAPAEALGYAEQAASLQPEDPNVLDTLGVVLLRNNQPERAVRRLREAVDRTRQAGTIRYHLAQALQASDRGDEAIRQLRTALDEGAAFSAASDARALLEELTAGQ